MKSNYKKQERVVERPAPANYSAEQTAVHDAVLDGSNVVVTAAAGSGKTFTLSHLAWRIADIRKDYTMSYVVFNTRNRKEAEAKFPMACDVSTLHQFGCQVLKSAGKLVVDEFKVWNFITKMVPNPSTHMNPGKEKEKAAKEFGIWKSRVKRLIDFARIRLMDQTVEDMMRCAVMEDIRLEMQDVETAHRILCEMNRQFYGDKTEVIPTYGVNVDFTDMIYLPVRFDHKCRFDKRHDLVMVDEFQDVSPMTMAMISRWMLDRKSTRFVVVGDRRQAIYGFAGADVRFFDEMEARPNTVTLTLGTCYRCAPAIILEARKYVDYIHPWEGNSGGVVRQGDYNEAGDGDFILSRRNRPVVSICLDMLSDGRKAIVRGRDIAEKLKEMLEDYDGGDFRQWLDGHAAKWVRAQCDKRGWEESKFRQTEICKNHMDMVGVLEDMEEKMEPSQMKEMIDSIFSDSDVPNAVILSTIHKSKGLESDRVFLLDIDHIQDYNLRYVGITRARHELVYCISGFEEGFGGLDAMDNMDMALLAMDQEASGY